MNARTVRCRYLGAHSHNQCTGEAVDPDAEILLCTRHLARAWALIKTAFDTERTVRQLRDEVARRA